MPYPALSEFSAELRARAARIRLAAFDVDGTLTDGRLWYDGAGEQLKPFHVQDGLGMKLLREQGIAVALITARQSAAVAARARDLGIAHLHQNATNKRDVLTQLAHELSLDIAQTAFMGDDLPDLPALALAGLAAAPADAHPWVRERAHWRSARPGGHGAVRELCDLLLSAQGHVEAIMQRYWPP